MRMWNVDPKIMCRKHLLGEHVELHMTVGTINKGRSVKGYLVGGFMDLSLVNIRHQQLVQEMSRRGYKHNSPLSDISLTGGNVNSEENVRELANRCPECRKLQGK